MWSIRVASGLILCSLSLEAQAPRRLTLGPPVATLGEEFSSIANMRELSDGRVLVTDFTEQRIVIGDFARNTARTIGRRGDGPGEYVLVTRLFPFGNGDSTLMPMELSKRWTVIAPDLTFSTIPPDVPIVTLMRSGMVSGTDNSGHILTHGDPVRRSGITRDTSPLILFSWRTQKMDTIARTDGGEAPRPPTGGRDRIRPFGGYDRAVLGADGWVAIVRHQPYRVEWRAPDAKWRIGPVIGGEVPFTAAEKAAYLERRAAARANASTKVISAPGVAKIKQGAAPPPEPEIEYPDRIPPFASRYPPLMSPRGDLLVRRTATAANPGPLFDVFDRAGNRTAQLAVAPNQNPIAFGASSLYVVTTDDDGIQKLGRHAWPVRP